MHFAPHEMSNLPLFQGGRPRFFRAAALREKIRTSDVANEPFDQIAHINHDYYTFSNDSWNLR